MDLLLSPAQIKVAEESANATGLSYEAMMEAAGRGCADFILSRYSADKKVVVLVGKGKNGGDGFVIARRLFEAGREVAVVRVSDPSMPVFDTQKPDFASLVVEPLFEDLVDFETFSKSDFRAVKVKDCVAVPKSKKLLQFTLDDGTSTDRTILSGIHAYYEPEQLIGKTCIAITNLPPRKMMGIDSCGMLISAVHKEGEEEKLHLLMVDPSIPAGAKLY